MLVEPVACDRVAVLGGLAEGEQRFVATQRGAAARDREDLVDGEERCEEVRRGFGERAVPASVPAQHRERNEDLR